MIRLLKYDKANDILTFAMTKKPKDIKTLSMLAQTYEYQGYKEYQCKKHKHSVKHFKVAYIA